MVSDRLISPLTAPRPPLPSVRTTCVGVIIVPTLAAGLYSEPLKRHLFLIPHDFLGIASIIAFGKYDRIYLSDKCSNDFIF